ncbi:hypothetical protein FRB99_002715 [Tulasnella sp. 403]|nr:hypothetical protein FRB99_002715 [Tulasnella sp. 403]
MSGQKRSTVSSATFFDLKAELLKKEDEFKRSKASGSGKVEAIVGGVKRPEKKQTSWMKKNKGVADRARRDIELEVSKQTVESAQAALEKKAKIYDKLQRGLTGGLSEREYDTLLVDFDRKGKGREYSSDEEDIDESLTVPRPPEGDEPDDDPVVEYQDEFGRTRKARRSEVPRHLLQEPEKPQELDDEYVILFLPLMFSVNRVNNLKAPTQSADHSADNPVGYYPTYEPTAEKVEAINSALEELRKAPTSYYDSTKENRAKGAGFYQFSADEETRRKQMEELAAARLDTVEKREEIGADLSRTGDTPKPVNPAIEKRKRELEERRKLIEAKRRKMQVDTNRAEPSIDGRTPE